MDQENSKYVYPKIALLTIIQKVNIFDGLLKASSGLFGSNTFASLKQNHKRVGLSNFLK